MKYFHYSAPDLCLDHCYDEHPVLSRFYMHTHMHTELYCLVSGKVVFHVEGTAYTLEPGDILLMRPGEAHYAQVDTQTPYERICMNLDTDILASLDPEQILTRPIFDRKSGKQNRYRMGQAGLDAMKRMIAVNSRMNILGNLILLLQELSQAFSQGAERTGDPDTLEYRIIRYINQNLDKELSLQFLCDRFFVSRTQLCKCFKQVTGASVGSYITVKRLLTARKLLQQGVKPTEVFAACGYQDYSTFFRAYTKLFGHSPRQEQSGQYALPPDARILIGQNAGVFSEEL